MIKLIDLLIEASEENKEMLSKAQTILNQSLALLTSKPFSEKDIDTVEAEPYNYQSGKKDAVRYYPREGPYGAIIIYPFGYVKRSDKKKLKIQLTSASDRNGFAAAEYSPDLNKATLFNTDLDFNPETKQLKTNISSRDISYLVHELVHYFDNTRMGIKITNPDPKDPDFETKYWGSAWEFNAHWMQKVFLPAILTYVDGTKELPKTFDEFTKNLSYEYPYVLDKLRASDKRWKTNREKKWIKRTAALFIELKTPEGREKLGKIKTELQIDPKISKASENEKKSLLSKTLNKLAFLGKSLFASEA
jgi:hypothetical protein